MATLSRRAMNYFSSFNEEGLAKIMYVTEPLLGEIKYTRKSSGGGKKSTKKIINLEEYRKERYKL